MRLREHLTYANVVATVALIVAVVGGGTAIAITAGKNTVTSRSIKNGNVTAKDLAGLHVVSAQTPFADAATDGNWSVAAADATCPTGERAIGGGGANTSPGPQSLTSQYPTLSPPGFHASGKSDGGPGGFIDAFALCLKAKPGR